MIFKKEKVFKIQANDFTYVSCAKPTNFKKPKLCSPWQFGLRR